jgi:general secretion pathway protein D
MTLAYDPALLEVEDVDAGEFLGSAKNAEVSSDRSTPGELVIGASRVEGAAGVAGHGAVARVRFRALAPGESAVSIVAHRVLDPELAELGAVSTSAARVAIGDEAVIEAPFATSDGRDDGGGD